MGICGQEGHPYSHHLLILQEKEIQWLPKHVETFKEMKAVIALDVLQCYPNHNLVFEVCTNASDYESGACIMQDDQPVAYCSRN